MNLALATACILFALDGDTARDTCGETFRLVGFDTPEHAPRAKCPQEAELARQAHERLGQLIEDGKLWGGRLERTGRKGKYGRTLARLFAYNRETGKVEDVGVVMIRDGLARPYDGGKRRSWC